MNEFQDVASLDSLPPGGQLKVAMGSTPLLLCHEAESGQVWAMKNSCPHAFQSMDGGAVKGGTIQCPKHGACFELSSGRSTNHVTSRPLTIYATRVEDGRILVSTQPVAALCPTTP